MLGCTKPTVVKHVPQPASQYTDTISGCGLTEGNQMDVAAPLDSSDGWFDKWSEGLVETMRRDMNYQQKMVKMQQVGDLMESVVVEQVSKYIQFLRDVASGYQVGTPTPVPGPILDLVSTHSLAGELIKSEVLLLETDTSGLHRSGIRISSSHRSTPKTACESAGVWPTTSATSWTASGKSNEGRG